MKKLMMLTVAGAAFVALSAATSHAIKPFSDQWKETYGVEDPQSDAQKLLAAATAEAKCYVCHVKGEKKEVKNAYGEALTKLLDKDNFKSSRRKAEPEKVKAEIVAALKKVEEMKAPTGETYGELISQGKLPVKFEDK